MPLLVYELVAVLVSAHFVAVHVFASRFWCFSSRSNTRKQFVVAAKNVRVHACLMRRSW